MTTRDVGAGLAIGEVLRRTRARRKLDVSSVEQHTKIRTKYLRALENEEWETLPGPAYAKGFLRTYAQFLGLDGDALVDEYRRSVESSLGSDQPHLLAEPLLERRARPVEGERSRWAIMGPVIAALVATAAIVILILGLTGGSGNEHHHRGRAHGPHHGKSAGTPPGQGTPSQAVSLALVTRDDMEVCLLPGHGQPLIDSQTLIAGTKEGPFEPPAENYRLDLDSGGAATVVLGGRPHVVRSGRPASFAIDSGGIREIDFKGPNCP
jgi:cytoskeleton protein RodZ